MYSFKLYIYLYQMYKIDKSTEIGQDKSRLACLFYDMVIRISTDNLM